MYKKKGDRQPKQLVVLISLMLGTGTATASIGPELWNKVYNSADGDKFTELYGMDFLDADTVLVSGPERTDSGSSGDYTGMAVRYQAATGDYVDTPPEFILRPDGTSRFYSQALGRNGDIYFAGVYAAGSGVFKYDSSGALQWYRSESGATNHGVAEDSMGNVYAVGRMGDAWRLAKYKADGSDIFARSEDYGAYSDVAAQVAVDSEDNYIVVGFIGDSNDDSRRKWLIRKYDKTDDSVIWEQTVGDWAKGQRPRAIVLDADDNVLVCGYLHNGSDEDAYWVKLKKVDGSLVWSQQSNTERGEICSDMRFDERGNFYSAVRVTNDDSRWRYHIEYRAGSTGELLKSQQLNFVDTAYATTEDNEYEHSARLDLWGNKLAMSATIFNLDASERSGRVTMLTLKPDIGEVKWQKTYSNSYGALLFGAFEAVDFLDDDTVLAAGHGPALAVRYDATTGDVKDTNPPEWLLETVGTTTYFFDQLIDADGNIYQAGRAAPDQPGVWKWSYNAINDSGDLQWKTEYTAGGSTGRLYGIADAGDAILSAGYYNGNWHISKRKKSDGSMVTGFPLVLDHAGLTDQAFSVAVDSKGDFVVAGFVTVDATIDHRDWYVRKYSSDGTLLWETSHDLNGLNDEALSVVIDSQDDVIVSGYHNAGSDGAANSNLDWYVVKYAGGGDGNGGASVIWSRSWDDGHERDGRASTLLLDERDNVYVGGSQKNSKGAERPYLQYLDGRTGEMLKFKRLPHPQTVNGVAGTAGTEYDLVNDLALNGQQLVVSGYVWEGYVTHGRTGFVQMLTLEHTVTANVSGDGMVSSAGVPEGIDMVNCATDCLGSYGANSQVTVTAQGTNPEWTLASWTWSGDCSGTDGDCVLTMDTDKTVNVAFSCKLMDLAQPASPIDTGIPPKECVDIKALNGYQIISGGEVFFNASNSISLGSGFSVNGGIFHALVQ